MNSGPLLNPLLHCMSHQLIRVGLLRVQYKNLCTVSPTLYNKWEWLQVRKVKALRLLRFSLSWQTLCNSWLDMTCHTLFFSVWSTVQLAIHKCTAGSGSDFSLIKSEKPVAIYTCLLQLVQSSIWLKADQQHTGILKEWVELISHSRSINCWLWVKDNMIGSSLFRVLMPPSNKRLLKGLWNLNVKQK